MSDVRAFRAYLNQYTDVARTSRYTVTFNVPRGVRSNSKVNNFLGFLDSGSGNPARKLALQCESAELPGRSFATEDVRTYGPIRKVPYQTAFNDAAFTFYCTGNNTSGILNLLNTAVEGGISQAIGGGIGAEVGALAGGFLNLLEGNNQNGLWERQLFDTWHQLINPGSNLNYNFNFAYPDDYTTGIVVTHYDSLGAPTIAYQYLQAWPIAVEAQPLAWAEDMVLKMTVVFAYTRWQPYDPNAGSFDVLLNPISNLVGTLASQITGSEFVGSIASGLISTDPLGETEFTATQGVSSLLGRL